MSPHRATLPARRQFLQRSACGLGALGLSQLLARDGAAETGNASPGPHFRARAKRVVFLFMAGAPSQLDLFDPKPGMRRFHRQPVPPSFLSNLDDPLIRGSAQVFASPRRFARHGQAGLEFSDYLPYLAKQADDLCIIRSMVTDVSNHHPAQLVMNCGVPRFGLPSMGSWVTYGLGRETENLPSFLVLLSNNGPGDLGGSALWDSAFLPAKHRGITLRSQGEPILHLENPTSVSRASQRMRLDAIRDLNQVRAATNPDQQIGERIAAYEMAYRMQMAAPELVDLSNETTDTLKLYGIDQEKSRWFGSNCLLARRMLERGVRFVQLYHYTWDDHSHLNQRLKHNCEMTDQPAAALIYDLKQRGLLDDTLVVWGSEFGRTPMNEVRRGNTPGKEGRDHHPFAFTTLLCGGGVKSGFTWGRTDDLGYHAIENPVHAHDLQATILHCLGLDHERLTYRHQGRDFRLTDVAGNVVRQVLA